MLTGAPSLSTVTRTAVVPYADKGLVSIVNELIVTLLAPSAKAVFDVSDLVSISAVASTVAAPADVTSAAEMLTDAIPSESVNAVPEVGESLASVSLVVKVTTALLAALPSAFFATTLTKPGLLLEIAVFAAPDTGSTKLMDSVGAADRKSVV